MFKPVWSFLPEDVYRFHEVVSKSIATESHLFASPHTQQHHERQGQVQAGLAPRFDHTPFKIKFDTELPTTTTMRSSHVSLQGRARC